MGQDFQEARGLLAAWAAPAGVSGSQGWCGGPLPPPHLPHLAPWPASSLLHFSCLFSGPSFKRWLFNKVDNTLIVLFY